MSKLFDTKTYNISEFVKWNDIGELNLSPKFQRNSVWNEQAKSYLVDTILRGLPIPPVFLRQTVDVKVSKIFKEVIDGQQRLRTIIEYYSDKFPIRGPFSESEYRGKYYSELSDELKAVFIEYEIATQIVKSQPDGIIYDMFARLNTNNMVLNNQEIRNAKYWGLFKGVIYELGREFKTYCLKWKMFNDRDLSRMRDYELLNSLVIYLLDGIKSETPRVIDEYYKKYDIEFAGIDTVMLRFNQIIGCIKLIYDHDYSLTYFNRPRYFYTLFVCLDKFKSINNTFPDTEKLIQKISLLENALESERNDSGLENLLKIKEYHLIRTTSIRERTERIKAVYKVLFNE